MNENTREISKILPLSIRTNIGKVNKIENKVNTFFHGFAFATCKIQKAITNKQMAITEI